MKYIAFFLLLLLVGCNSPSPTQIKEKLKGETKAERVVAVGIQRVDTVEGVVKNTYPGTLEESQSIDMSFKYGGTLEQLYVGEGTTVRKGQMLARVSSPSLESSQRSAKATLEQAQDAYNRLKIVHDNGSLPEIKWNEMLANLEKAEANAELADAMVEENVIRAPFDGTVTSIDGKVGQNVSPFQPMMKLINTDGMVVRISVPENEIYQHHLDEEATVTIPALGDRVFEGVIVEKGVSASLLAHSYPVKVLVRDADEALMPGMIGKVALKSDMTNAIVIPSNVVLLDNEGKFVWIANDGKATRRRIVVDGYLGSGVVVSSGLQCGDCVIVEGYQKVSEGMRVKEYEKD